MDYFKKFANQGYELATYTPVTKDEAYSRAGELRGIGRKIKIVRQTNNTYSVLVKEKGKDKRLKKE